MPARAHLSPATALIVLALAATARGQSAPPAADTDASLRESAPEPPSAEPASAEPPPAVEPGPESPPEADAGPPPTPPRVPVVTDKPPLGIFPSPEDSLMDPRMARSWGALPARAFVATTFDAGFVYVRPRVSFGYGRPFTSWIGADVNAIAQTSGLGSYAGVRLEIPHVDWRVGARYFASFNRTYLAPQTSYSRLELETGSGDPARTLTFETELDLTVRLGPGTLLARGSASYVTGVPGEQFVFEEALHAIVDPPLVWRARGGYALVFGAYHQHSIGLVVDALDVPKRDDSLTLRAGPILRFVLSRRVEVRGSFVMTITSPDRIGLVGGDFTDLGVRYRWASE